MLITKKAWLWSSISLLGIVFGLLTLSDDIPAASGSPQECRRMAVFGFSFFFCFMLVNLLMKQIAVAIGKFLRKVATRRSGSHSMFSNWGDPFFIYGGIFFLFLGMGLSMSACWRGSIYFWEGLEFFSDGLGLILGTWVSSKLFKKLNPDETFDR